MWVRVAGGAWERVCEWGCGARGVGGAGRGRWARERQAKAAGEPGQKARRKGPGRAGEASGSAKQVAAPAAYGSSQARGRATATVEATPSSYVVSHTGSPLLFILIF